jgi:HK97 family phage major capsid protein
MGIVSVKHPRWECPRGGGGHRRRAHTGGRAGVSAGEPRAYVAAAQASRPQGGAHQHHAVGGPPRTRRLRDVGLSYEIVSDWPAFQQYAGGELFKQIIDVENNQLLSGDGVGLNMTGFYATSGILTHDASADTGTGVTALDSIEIAITALRTGPALATPDLLVLHPSTWSKLRCVTDATHRAAKGTGTTSVDLLMP